MIVPAVNDLNMCRRLKCTWNELQEMPEERVLVWEALLNGEDHARREAAAPGNAGGGS